MKRCLALALLPLLLTACNVTVFKTEYGLGADKTQVWVYTDNRATHEELWALRISPRIAFEHSVTRYVPPPSP
jgi:predicted small secreted protein